LRFANELLSGSEMSTSASELRARLAAGHTVEIAGYPLSSELAANIAQLSLRDSFPLCPVAWFEIVPKFGREPSSAALQVAGDWRTKGAEVDMTTVVGEPFWSSTNGVELVQCSALVDATARAARSWL
jgi:hypothetical protein